jgi:hypothetical protein
MSRSTPTTHDIEPWYKQGWPWLLISLPASAVVGGIITIFLAVNSPNAMVVDDYYKEGLAINEKKQRQANAARMALRGLLRHDGSQLTLSLSSAAPVTEDALSLHIAPNSIGNSTCSAPVRGVMRVKRPGCPPEPGICAWSRLTRHGNSAPASPAMAPSRPI